MKKLFLVLAAALVAIAPLSAQVDKDVARTAKKDAAKSAKAALKEGYTMLESGDLETRIAKHLEKVYAKTAFEITNTAEGKRSVNMAKTMLHR